MKRMIAVILLVTFLLTGCSSVGMDPQALMRPPRPTGDKEKIHEVLENKAGNSFKLKYPKRGQYRSAIVMNDITGDHLQEAIALYESEGEGITVIFIGGFGGEWRELGSFTNPATQVDMVCFGDLNGDGVQEIIVGWGSAINNANDICIYSSKDGKVSELSMKQSYSQMVVMDFDSDGKDEIFTASVSTAEQQAIARLSRIRNGTTETMGTANLDAGVTRYLSVASGLINENQTGVLIDGLKSNGTTAAYVTELLYWDKQNKILQSPFYNPNTQSADYVKRYTSSISRDINGDKLLEFPIVNPLPGYTAPAPDETCYITNWHRYNCEDSSLMRVMSMVINSKDGYWFMIPDMWREKVTVKTDFTTKVMTFYEWVPVSEKSQSGALGAALLKLKVFTDKEWEDSTLTKGYNEMIRKDNFVYAASLPQSENPLSLILQDVKNSFELVIPQE